MTEVFKRKVYFCGQDAIESFRTTRINPEFKKLPIENFYSAAASNSGPVALLYRKYGAKQLKLPQNYDSNVLFFNCKGDLLRTVAFELKERVILFDFTPDEQLLIVYANATYFLVDPATANTRTGSLFGDEDTKSKNRCSGAQLIGHRIVLLRERVLGVAAVGVPWKGITAIKLNIENPVFGCGLTTTGELQITYLSANCTVDILNVERWQESSSPPTTLFSSPALKSNALNLVSLGKQDERMAFIFTDRAILGRTDSGSVIFPFNEFTVAKEDPVAKSESKSKYRNFYKIGFVDNTVYFFDRVRLLLLSLTEPHFEIRHLSLTSLLAASNVGFRLLDEHTFIFRPIRSPLYFALVDKEDVAMRLLSHADDQSRRKYEHFQELLGLYERFTEKRPIDVKRAQAGRQWAQQVWEATMSVAELFIDPGEQLMALKFASFLLSYFGFAKRCRVMADLAKELRVVNNLRHEGMNRWVTYQQFQTLKATDHFLLLLLRYNMHFVADMIYGQSAAKQRIFAHWARCKIEKETEGTALQEIKAKYKDMRVALGATALFSELARYCLQHPSRSLVNLALQLGQLEPHPARRTIVFLSIFLNRKEPQWVDKLLQHAENSANTSAIHQVIQSLRRVSQDWLPPKAWLETLPRKPLLQYHYIHILKANGDLQELKQYLTLNSLFVEMSYTSLAKQLAKMQSPSLEAASQLISRDYSKVLTSLADQLSKCTRRTGVETLRELKAKKYPITEQDANSLTKDGQLQVLAELIIKKDGNLPLAARILRKMKSDKVYSLLVRKGKVKDAIEQAFARKNKEKMQELIPLADESMQPLARQLLQELSASR